MDMAAFTRWHLDQGLHLQPLVGVLQGCPGVQTLLRSRHRASLSQGCLGTRNNDTQAFVWREALAGAARLESSGSKARTPPQRVLRVDGRCLRRASRCGERTAQVGGVDRTDALVKLALVDETAQE